MWMLDTDTCSYILRAHPPMIAARFREADRAELGISSVVLAELYDGIELLPNSEVLRANIQRFLAGLTLLSWDAAAAAHYGDIRATLQRKGTPIGAMDMMIAAHARSLRATLVTNNSRHFRRVPGLKTENWL